MKKKSQLLSCILSFTLIFTIFVVPSEASSKNLEQSSTWARTYISNAIDYGFVPAEIQNNYTQVITREEFCKMAIKFIEYATNQNINQTLSQKGLSRNYSAFRDTSDNDILAASALGITSGTAAQTFSPNQKFSREQAATMIYNICKVLEMDVSKISDSGYSDISSASSWAVSSINFCNTNKIMSGTSTTPLKFSPKSTYTREEAIVAFCNIPYIKIALNGISLYDSPETVNSILELRTSIATSDGKWELYGDYDEFVAVFFLNNKATYIHVNHPEFSSDKKNYTIYTDSNDNNKTYGASIGIYPINDTKTTELMIFEFTNAFRSLHDLKALKWNNTLATAALSHSKDMAANNFFAHINLSGQDPSDRIKSVGYNYSICGENINAGYSNAVTGVDGWIQSSGHRKAMLNSQFDEIGVGWSLGNNQYSSYGTQLFATKY